MVVTGHDHPKAADSIVAAAAHALEQVRVEGRSPRVEMARDRNPRDDRAIRSHNGHCEAGEGLADIGGIALRADLRQSLLQSRRIDDRARCQRDEGPACQICLALRLGQVRQHHLADARAIGLQLHAYTCEKSARTMAGLQPVRHHVVFERAELDDRAHFSGQLMQDRRSDRDDDLLLVQAMGKPQQPRSGDVPSARRGTQISRIDQRRDLPMRSRYWHPGNPRKRRHATFPAVLDHGEGAVQGNDAGQQIAHDTGR